MAVGTYPGSCLPSYLECFPVMRHVHHPRFARTGNAAHGSHQRDLPGCGHLPAHSISGTIVPNEWIPINLPVDGSCCWLQAGSVAHRPWRLPGHDCVIASMPGVLGA